MLECISPPDAGRLQAWLLECQRDPLELPFMFGETYHLTRTSAPVHWDDGTLLSTHTFAIITTMPCADKVQLPLRPAPARVSSRQTFRPFEPPVRPPGEAPGTVPVDSGVPPAHRTAQSLSYRRDGSLNTQYLRSTIAPEGTDPTSGLPYDVKQLLMTTDWSKSPLGPMELWPPAMLGLVNTTIVVSVRRTSTRSAQANAHPRRTQHAQRSGVAESLRWCTISNSPRRWSTTTLLRLDVLDLQRTQRSRTFLDPWRRPQSRASRCTFKTVSACRVGWADICRTCSPQGQDGRKNVRRILHTALDPMPRSDWRVFWSVLQQHGDDGHRAV